MNKKCRSLLCLLVAALCMVGLSGCLCSDLPFVIDGIGREYSRNVCKYESPHEVEIYRLGDNYYAKCDLKFIPHESGLFTWYELYASESSLFRFNKCTPELLDATPSETYMVLMSPFGVKFLLQIEADAPAESTPIMIPLEQFDFANAVRCKPNPDREYLSDLGWNGSLNNIVCYTERCSTLHDVLRPLYWASWVVEIPFIIVSNTAIYTVILPASVIEAVTQQQNNEIHTEPYLLVD